MMAEGTWWLRSKIDPRWNATGRDLVGMFGTPEAAREKIKALTASFGAPPEDLEVGYMKD